MSWPIYYEYDGDWMQLENSLENAFTDWPDGPQCDSSEKIRRPDPT